MVYCNFCEHFNVDEEDYFCCIYKDRILLGFNMDDLNKECPKK